MARLVLVRHAQASFGAEDYDQLSELGHEQSRLLGAWFLKIGLKPDQWISGGQKRHDQTLSGITEAIGLAVPDFTVDPGFAEFDFHDVLIRAEPDYRGQIGEMMRADPAAANRRFQFLYGQAIDRWIGGAFDSDYVLSWPEFRDRVRAGLERVLANSQAEATRLIVTSGGPLSAIFHLVTGCPVSMAFLTGYRLYNTGVTRLDCGGGKPLCLMGFNAVSHIEASGAARLLTYR